MRPTSRKVNSTYGAPMGRHEFGTAENTEPKSVFLYRVKLDSGGYDQGGAYWGLRPAGRSLFCAYDGDGFMRLTDAASRAHAALLLGIPLDRLRVGPGRVIRFGRYQATKVHGGHAQPTYKVDEFGQYVRTCKGWEELCEFASLQEMGAKRA